MGALIYQQDRAFKTAEDISDLNTLAVEVARVLNNDYQSSLEILFNKGGSSGGARPKVRVRVDNKDWLIKFRASNDPEDIGQIEYHYSLAAK